MTPAELQAARELIAARAECAGPMTTIVDGRAHVAIITDKDRYDTVIQWLAMCERTVPQLLAEVERLTKERGGAIEMANLHIATSERLGNERRDAAAERDAYRALACDLLPAVVNNATTATLRSRARELLKHGPAPRKETDGV